jgi:ATP-binding cassette subfamily F protein 3
VKSGVFEQTNVENLNPNYTVEEEILASSPHIDRQTARNICGAMMFGGDDALKKTSVLSGGEKSRVMLGKLLASPVNLLLLDEPTNHLDMESNDALLMALNNFGGAIVMVTHNEMFLHALADRLVVFKDNGIDLFDGSYARFLDKVGWDNIVDSNPSPKRTVSGQDVGLKKNRRSLRREKSRLIFERSQAIKVIKQDIEKVEAKIESSESLLEKYNMEAIEASKQGNGDRIARLSKKIRNLQSDIGSLYNDLEALLNRLDNKESDFDRLIDACE